jgi:hypothetical protein
MAYNFQTGNSEIKLFTEYESVTQSIETTLRRVYGAKYNFLSYIFIFLKHFYFIISGLKIVGRGSPYSNLESPCNSVQEIPGRPGDVWFIFNSRRADASAATVSRTSKV